MAHKEAKLKLLDGIFEEAVRLHGDDPEKVVDNVKAQIAALSPGERLHIDEAFARMLAFAAPDSRRGPLN
jgi:hypothetical protein